MYQGNNKSALFSQKLIGEAMLQLLEEHSFSEISISDLCKNADVSRQTFYSLFGSKENVIIYELQISCCFMPDKHESTCRSADFSEFCRGYSSYIIDKKHILELLVKNEMMHFLYDVQYKALMECEHFVGDVTGEDRIFLVDFIVSGMNSIAKNCVLTENHSDRRSLELLMFRLFGGLYFTETRAAERN